MTMSGHPENFGWKKCRLCGAHRPAQKLAAIAAAGQKEPHAFECFEGCAPLRIEDDPRRELRTGRYPNEDLEGPVLRPVAAETSIASVINEHLEPELSS